MKKLVLFVALAALMLPANVLKAQLERKGYVGFSIGPSFLTGSIHEDIKPQSGGGLGGTICNFGYLFTPHIGIHSSFFAMVHAVKQPEEYANVQISGLLVGPQFSTATVNEKFEFDLRPTIGFGQGIITLKGGNDTLGKGFAVTFGVGGSVRWNFGKRWSLALTIDYYNSKPEEDDQKRKMDLSYLLIANGLNFRF